MIKYLYKDAFAVIGKMGQGTADNPQEWITPLWEAATSNFKEVESLIRKNESAAPLIWGAMNDIDESNKRWGEEGLSNSGKYMASGEADVDAVAPEGWTKWVIPAQTYLVASCTMEEYADVFKDIVDKLGSDIIGSVHEFYPEAGNPNVLDIYFPISQGMMFCQSCYMPLTKPEDRGTESDNNPSRDYCCHCYAKGRFTDEMTYEEAVETNIPFWRDGCKNDDEARAKILAVFPTLKRWANGI